MTAFGVACDMMRDTSHNQCQKPFRIEDMTSLHQPDWVIQAFSWPDEMVAWKRCADPFICYTMMERSDAFPAGRVFRCELCDLTFVHWRHVGNHVDRNEMHKRLSLKAPPGRCDPESISVTHADGDQLHWYKQPCTWPPTKWWHWEKQEWIQAKPVVPWCDKRRVRFVLPD